MSIIYPVVPEFRGINLSMQDDTIVSRSQNGRRLARKAGGQFFSLTLTYPPLDLAGVAPVRGAIAKARGQFNTFTVIPPNLKDPQGTQITPTTVSVDAPVGSTSISVTGAGATSTFKAGDILGFNNHVKVYMVVDDSVAVAGVATISFVPPLITSVVAASTSAIHSDVPFTVALTNNLQKFSTSVNGFSSYELDVEESF